MRIREISDDDASAAADLLGQLGYPGRAEALPARLAAMAPNPRFYERNPGAPGLARKVGIILARMPAAEIP